MLDGDRRWARRFGFTATSMKPVGKSAGPRKAHVEVIPNGKPVPATWIRSPEPPLVCHPAAAENATGIS